MMRKLLLLAGCCASCMSINAQQKWNLRQCVDYALANNVSVKQSDVQARLSALTYRQSRLQQIPTANLSGNLGVNSGRYIDPSTNTIIKEPILFSGVNFNTSVTLFNWFNLKNTIAGNELEWEAARAGVDKLKNDVSLNVASAYLLVLVSQETANVAEVTLRQSQQNRNNIRRRVDAGSLPELNYLEADAQVARDSATLITSRATVQQNLLQLKAVMNLDAATPFDVEMPPLDQIPVEPISELQPDVVYNLAVQNLPQQKVNELRIQAAHKFIKAAKGNMYPTISAFGGMNTQYAKTKQFQQTSQVVGFRNTDASVIVNGSEYGVRVPVFAFDPFRVPFGSQFRENFGQNVGLSLNIPIFNNGVARTAWQRSKLNLENLELQKQLDAQTLKQDIYRAYNDAIAALERFHAAEKTIQTAQLAFDFSQKRYDIGLQSTIEYLTNQNNLFRARIERLQAQVEYVFRLKVLEFYRGQGIKL